MGTGHRPILARFGHPISLRYIGKISDKISGPPLDPNPGSTSAKYDAVKLEHTVVIYVEHANGKCSCITWIVCLRYVFLWRVFVITKWFTMAICAMIFSITQPYHVVINALRFVAEISFGDCIFFHILLINVLLVIILESFMKMG